MTDPAQIALLCGIFLIAGTVKGAAGMGLPTTAISLMTMIIDPRSAIAVLLVPMICSNGWQVWRAGEIIQAARRYLPFATAMMVGVAVTVWLAQDAADQVLLATLGFSLLIFVAVNATRWAPRVTAARDRPAQFLAGAVAGVMGGMTAVWAPPMAVYLAARRVGKTEFVRASGLLIFLGSLPLAAGYLQQGYLTKDTSLLSLAMLVPTFAGFTLGERIRNRMSESGFRVALLVLFALMGLNLIRRAMG